MNRRKLLKTLGIGAAIVPVAAALTELPPAAEVALGSPVQHYPQCWFAGHPEGCSCRQYSFACLDFRQNLGTAFYSQERGGWVMEMGTGFIPDSSPQCPYPIGLPK